MKTIIAVDFDGTCVTHEYPEVGKTVNNAVKTLKRLNEADVKIILWTMRSGEFLQDAVKWFEENGIELWGVNENPEQKEWTESRKAYAQIYIDDAALGCPLLYPFDGGRPFVDWFTVENTLIGRGILVREVASYNAPKDFAETKEDEINHQTIYG